MTPAVVTAKKWKIAFNLLHFTHEPGTSSFAEEAAQKLGLDGERVFKTLIIVGASGELAVAIVPALQKLNMKKIAKELSWKKASMADKHSVSRSSGYVIGGVSPLGQKKELLTVIDTSSKAFETILVSAGKRGLEIELSPQDLALVTRASFAEITDKKIRSQ